MNEKIIDFEAHRLKKNRDRVKDRIENALWEMADQIVDADNVSHFEAGRLWEISRQIIREELISLNGKLSAESGMPEFKHLTEEDVDKCIQDFEEHTPKPWDDQSE